VRLPRHARQEAIAWRPTAAGLMAGGSGAEAKRGLHVGTRASSRRSPRAAPPKVALARVVDRGEAQRDLGVVLAARRGPHGPNAESDGKGQAES